MDLGTQGVTMMRQGKHITSMADLVDHSKRLHSPFEPELASDAKGRQWHPKKYK